MLISRLILVHFVNHWQELNGLVEIMGPEILETENGGDINLSASVSAGHWIIYISEKSRWFDLLGS